MLQPRKGESLAWGTPCVGHTMGTMLCLLGI